MATEKEETQIQTAIRIPASWLERFDKIAEQRSEPGLQLNRTDAFRLVIARGLEQLESEGKKKR